MSHGFSIEHHRRVAERYAAGQSNEAELAASQRMLLDEVTALTGALPVGDDNIALASDFGSLLDVLLKTPNTAMVCIETNSDLAHATSIGSYKVFNDHLAISSGQGAARTVDEALTSLYSIRRSGFKSKRGIQYRSAPNTPVWLVDENKSSGRLLVGVRLETSKVILVGEK